MRTPGSPSEVAWARGLLGVDADADAARIRRAWRARAAAAHPDRAPAHRRGDAERACADLNHARDVALAHAARDDVRDDVRVTSAPARRRRPTATAAPHRQRGHTGHAGHARRGGARRHADARADAAWLVAASLGCWPTTLQRLRPALRAAARDDADADTAALLRDAARRASGVPDRDRRRLRSWQPATAG